MNNNSEIFIDKQPKWGVCKILEHHLGSIYLNLVSIGIQKIIHIQFTRPRVQDHEEDNSGYTRHQVCDLLRIRIKLEVRFVHRSQVL